MATRRFVMRRAASIILVDLHPPSPIIPFSFAPGSFSLAWGQLYTRTVTMPLPAGGSIAFTVGRLTP